MLAALRYRSFALLWSGGLISAMGDWVLFIALPFYIFARTGSTLATSAMFAVVLVPWVFLGSVAGVFADRWDRRRTMIAADLSRAALLLLLLVVQSRDLLWIVYPVAFVEQAISAFFRPARDALVPRLVGADDLMAANSLDSVADSLSRLVGPPLGGALLGFVGLPGVVLVDSASYLISGLLIALVRVRPAPMATPVPEAPVAAVSWSAFWRDWLDGLRVVRRDRVITALFIVAGTVTFGDSMTTVLLVPFAKKVLLIGPLQLGWMITAQGVGGLVGALVVGRVGKVIPPARLLALGLGVLGALFVVLVNSRSFPLILCCIAVAGVFVAAAMIAEQTLLQNNTTDAYRGRVFGAYGTTTSLLRLVGTGLAGAIGGPLGIVVVLDVVGALYLLSSGLAAVLLPRAAPDATLAPAEIPPAVETLAPGEQGS